MNGPPVLMGPIHGVVRFFIFYGEVERLKQWLVRPAREYVDVTDIVPLYPKRKELSSRMFHLFCELARSITLSLLAIISLSEEVRTLSQRYVRCLFPCSFV